MGLGTGSGFTNSPSALKNVFLVVGMGPEFGRSGKAVRTPSEKSMGRKSPGKGAMQAKRTRRLHFAILSLLLAEACVNTHGLVPYTGSRAIPARAELE